MSINQATLRINLETPVYPSRSATVIVAANDSSDKSKDVADYVCDGVADNIEITNAIAEIGAMRIAGKHRYGLIQFLEGDYFIKNKIVVNENVHFLGLGRNCTYLKRDAGMTDECFFSLENETNGGICQFREMKFVGTSALGAGDYDNPLDCIRELHSQELQLINCELTHFRNGAGVRVLAEGSHDWHWNQIHGTWFFGNKDGGIVFDASETGFLQTQIAHCIFLGNHTLQGGGTIPVPSLVVSPNAILTNLIFSGNQIRNGGLFLGSGSQYSITGNNFMEGIGDYGIRFSSRNDMTNIETLIEGNNFLTDGSYTNLINIETNVDGVDIIGNRLYGEVSNKILIAEGSNVNGTIQSNSPKSVNV